MTDKTLSKARGLNSIANPRDFKGASGRGRTGPAANPPPAPSPPSVDPTTQKAPEPGPIEGADGHGGGLGADPATRPPGDETPANRPPAMAAASGQVVPAGAAGARAASSLAPAAAPGAQYQPEPVPAIGAPRRAVTPGLARKRRELTVPTPVAEALDRTGINPADVVMAGYRRHADTIYGGGGGRMLARGRTRLRLSISDSEFDHLTRLGEARGWNRSEVVSVILAMELLPANPAAPR